MTNATKLIRVSMYVVVGVVFPVLFGYGSFVCLVPPVIIRRDTGEGGGESLMAQNYRWR